MVSILAGCIQVKIPIGRPNEPGIAQCRNVRGLRRVSLIDEIENVNISTEMLLSEKLPAKV